MPILAIDSLQPTGLTSVNPSVIYILTSDTYATVTATGYLTLQKQQGFIFNNQQMALVYTTDDGPVWLKVVITYSGASILNTVVSLVELSSPGSIVLPTIANHIATYTNTAGTLSEDAATAINGGNIQAGLSGTAGYLASFPSTAAKGSFRVTAVANTGDTLTTLSNVAMGQASVISIPDPANAVGRLLVGATATPFVSGNFPQNSGTGGLMVDSGIAVSALATTSTAVLLTPAADQTITIHNLTVAQGNVTAGSSGHAASLISFPTTAANGSLIIAAADAGGAFNSTISNGTIGQSTVFTLPDPGNAAARILVGATATPFTTAHILASSGTGGLVADSGIATAAVQLNTNIKAQQVSALGGGGAGPLTVTAAGAITSSVICVDIVASSNPVSVQKVTPGTGNFALLLSGDPGATLTISYIMFIAAQ